MTLNAEGARPCRVVSVQISGDTAKRPQSTTHRLDFLVAIARAIRQRGWTEVDAIVLPAGYLRADLWLAPLTAEERRHAVNTSELGMVCRFAISRIAERSPGCVLVVGIDTNRHRPWGFRGDQALAAFNDGGCITVVRKIFPTDGDTNEWGRTPYLLDRSDADGAARFLPLPSGRSAMLCVCYDSFVFSELALGPTTKLRAMRYQTDPIDGWDGLKPWQAWDWLQKLDSQIELHRPTVVLNPIHGFDRQGGDVFWQRHGLSVASSALGGGLAVGAAHYRRGLPNAEHAMMAALGAPSTHIQQGGRRRAYTAPAIDSFTLQHRALRGLGSLIQLFEG